MTLVEQIKARISQAMKARNTIEKEILRVALGEMQIAETRAGSLSDDEAAAIVRKLLKSNHETLGLTADAEQKQTLTQEIAILESLLPKTLGVDEIVTQLAPLAEQLRAAKSAGQATGIAVKHLKSADANVGGKDVAAAVERIRSST
ncbi:MAG TPA: GatB/YqeY domain-containing protein [Polyangiaceae bacterium]|nr:GatB/YqeY domain-containing protein [Polyangiaceae bacterium]